MFFIKKILLSIILITSLFLSSCAPQKAQQISGFYLDTFCEITLYGDDAKHLSEAMNLIQKYDTSFDPDNETSDIYKINHSNGNPIKVSKETAELIEICLDFKKISHGEYEPTIYGLSSLWKQGAVPDEKALKSALEDIKNSEISVTNGFVTLKGEAKFDPGSSAKGYISEKIATLLSELGVKSGIINLGGNVQLIGSKENKPYKIALESPFDDNSPFVLYAENTSISTCGTYERFFEENGKIYHHILDVKTGYPKESELSAVTVIGPSPTEADILSTVCFLLGEIDGKALIESLSGYEAIFISSSKDITTTSGIEISENNFYIK
ncbi:MAG: FAD:protein FMN transferase [Oscillospiraceae bacterium]|nr:FAD:protein FMN transferase [Oscillospiraceae bacterium]